MIIVKDKILHEYNKDCEGDGVQVSELKDGSRVTKCKTVLLHSPAGSDIVLVPLWHFVACAQHVMHTYIKPVLGKAEVQPLS